MTLYPVDHLKVEHNYTDDSWQDFTGDLTAASINLREFTGKHTALLSFYNATMDPSQVVSGDATGFGDGPFGEGDFGAGSAVIKKGDKVRISMKNASGTLRKTATFTVKKVEVAIDLSQISGRQHLVTVNLQGKGITGVGGAA